MLPILKSSTSLLKYLHLKHLHLKEIALFSVFSIAATGCNQAANVQPSNIALPERSENSSKCPEQPQGTLKLENVKPISISDEVTKEGGFIQTNKHFGYSFEAQAGQEVYINTEDKICFWIYTPENEILNSNVLPRDGNYVIQISALKGATTFNIELGLDKSRLTSEPQISSSIALTSLTSSESSNSQPSSSVIAQRGPNTLHTQSANEVQALINDPDGYTNVRSGAGIQHEIIARVRDGEIFYTIPQQSDWWPVRTQNNNYGYMHQSRIKLMR